MFSSRTSPDWIRGLIRADVRGQSQGAASKKIPCQFPASREFFPVMAILLETSARPRSLSRHLEDERAEFLYLDLHRIAWIGIFGLDEASEKYECALLETQAS